MEKVHCIFLIFPAYTLRLGHSSVEKKVTSVVLALIEFKIRPLFKVTIVFSLKMDCK